MNCYLEYYADYRGEGWAVVRLEGECYISCWRDLNRSFRMTGNYELDCYSDIYVLGVL